MTLCHLILLFHAILVAIGTFSQEPSHNSTNSAKGYLHQSFAFLYVQGGEHFIKAWGFNLQNLCDSLLVKVWGHVPKVCWKNLRLMGVFLAENNRSWISFVKKMVRRHLTKTFHLVFIVFLQYGFFHTSTYWQWIDFVFLHGFQTQLGFPNTVVQSIGFTETMSRPQISAMKWETFLFFES